MSVLHDSAIGIAPGSVVIVRAEKWARDELALSWSGGPSQLPPLAVERDSP